MPGTVLKLSVAVGDKVANGDELLVLEAMKMEVPVKAFKDGTVTAINVGQGDAVVSGQELVVIG